MITKKVWVFLLIVFPLVHRIILLRVLVASPGVFRSVANQLYTASRYSWKPSRPRLYSRERFHVSDSSRRVDFRKRFLLPFIAVTPLLEDCRVSICRFQEICSVSILFESIFSSELVLGAPICEDTFLKMNFADAHQFRPGTRLAPVV
jgi:hypothetical protein